MKPPKKTAGQTPKDHEGSSRLFSWKQRTLTQHDWDFSECPEDELRLCLYYECARDVMPVRKAVEQWQKEHPGADPLKALEYLSMEAIERADWPPYDVCHAPEFPNTPWLQIPPKQRGKLLQISQFAPTLAALPLVDMGDLLNYCEKEDPTSQTLRVGQWREVAAFVIDWEMSPPNLIKAFARWLEENKERFESTNTQDPDIEKFEKAVGFEPLPKLKRERLRTRLKELGAFRVLQVCRWDRAQIMTTNNANPDWGLYALQSDWIKARKNALETLQLFPNRFEEIR